MEDKATVFSGTVGCDLLRHHTLLFFFFADKAGCHAKQQLSFGASWLRQPSKQEKVLTPSSANERGSSPARRRRAAKGELEEGERLKSTEGGKGREPHTREECTPTLAPTRPHLSLVQQGRQFYSGAGVTGILKLNPHSTCPKLMAGLALSADTTLPPQGIYCWTKALVFRSCLLCLSQDGMHSSGNPFALWEL